MKNYNELALEKWNSGKRNKTEIAREVRRFVIRYSLHLRPLIITSRERKHSHIESLMIMAIHCT